MTESPFGQEERVPVVVKFSHEKIVFSVTALLSPGEADALFENEVQVKKTIQSKVGAEWFRLFKRFESALINGKAK
jgi:hypothetical protein